MDSLREFWNGMDLPEKFWFAFQATLCVGELAGYGSWVFLLMAAPFLWARFWEISIPTQKMDPLDGPMTVMAGIMALGSAASYVGLGSKFLLCFFILEKVAHRMAPARKFPTGAQVTENCNLSGKVVYITGPTSGIGTETARVLCMRGAHVILASRSERKLERTKIELEQKCPAGSKVSTIQVDLGDLESIRESIKKVEELGISKIDILINNAGIMALPKRRETKQGFEMQMGVNHLGHSLLTQLLTPYLKKATPARVVCLSSMAHFYHDDRFFDHPKLECDPYHNWMAYGNAKMANVMFAMAYNDRHRDEGVTAYSVHPGGIFTGLQGDVELTKFFKWLVVAPFFFKSIEQGCATTLFCATQPGIEADAGKYFDNCRVASSKQSRACTDEQAKKLMDATEKLVAA